MKRALDLWPLVLGLLTLVGALDPTKPPDDNATTFMTHITPEGTQSTWDGDIPAINQGLIPEESPESSFLIEGDIIKRPFQLFSAASFKWPKKDGIVKIPYLFSSKYDQPSREVILEAFADFEHFTCVRFVPRTNQKDFVSIIPMSGCFSSVGHSGGMQVASLAPFCLQKGKGIVLHELMHVLGFWHEHSRADRDRYIHISWKEIRPGFEINFIKSQNSNMLVPYDYTSVMHYGRYAFSKSGNTTILPLAGPDIPIGQRWNLSTSDIVRINRLYECSQTVKDSGFHGENNGSHRKLGVVELIDQKEKKLRPTEAPFKALPSLQAVSQAGEGDRESPGWPISAPSEHPQGREMANTTWSILPSSPGADWIPEIVSPSEAVPSETVKNRPVSLHNTVTALLVSEPSTSAPLLTLLSRGTMASFPEPTSLPEIHNSILAVGQRGGLPGAPLPGRGDWYEGMAPLVSFSSGLQSPSPDWWARPKSTPASTRTSHSILGSGPGPHRCQLCPQEETDSVPTAGGGALASGGRGFLWRLLKALTMASASRNLPPLRGARARGLGAGDQLFSAELRGNTALSEPPGVVFPAHGTHNPQAAEEPAQTLIEGERREADFGEEEQLKQIAFGVATGIPDGARQKLSLSMGQGSTWPRWGPKHGSSEKDVLKQSRRDSFSGDHVGAHLSQAKSLSSSHNLSWASSMALTPREGIPDLRRGNGDFMVPGAVLGNPVIPSLGVASNSTREEFGSGLSTLFPEKKVPTSSQEGELHSLQIQASQSEVGLPNTLPAPNSQTPSSTPVAPALFLKPLTNKIPAQMESPVLAAFIQTPHLSHLMENVTRNRFIFSVSQRNPPYLGMETPNEAFQRSGGAHSEVRTTAVDGKEERQIGSLFTVGSAFPEGEVASPAVSVNSVLSLEDSGNQKPHPSGRIIQGSLGVTEKNQILSSAPLRCPPGGIQLFLGGSMIPLLPMEPERIPRGYKSKETLKFLSLGVGRKVASFLSWISNSSSVTLGHPVPLPRSLEHSRSQTFLLAETKPGMLRPERAADPKLAGPGIVLLKSPLGLLSLVPLWECWDPSGVRKLAYFSEPEALEKEYSPASGESSSSATEAVVLPLQTLKTQIPFLDRPQEKKGRDQFGITPLPLIQTTVKMTHLVRNKVIQMLREEHETSKEQGGRDPKFLPFRSSFGEALPLRNPSLGLDASFQRRPLPALGTQTSNWAGGTLPPLASSAVGPELWPQEGGAAWTRVLPGEPMMKEGRLKFQAHPKLLSLIGPGMEPQLTDVPSAGEAHNEKAREEGKTPSLSPSRAGHGNKPSTDYFNPRETLSVSLLDHKAWMAQHRVQSRPTDDEHISQMLPYGSLPSVRRETVPATFKTEREAEELRNVVGKNKSLAESSAVHSERAKSSSSQLHFVNLSSPLDQPIKSTKTKSKVPSSQGRKGGLVSFSSMGITLPLDKTSYFRMTILPSFSSSPSSSPSLSPSSSPSLSPSSSPSLSPSSSPSLSPSSSPSLSPSSSPSLSPSSSPSLSPSSSPSLSPSSSPSLSPSSSPSLSPSSSPSLSPSSSPSLSPSSSPSLSPSSSPSLSPSSSPSLSPSSSPSLSPSSSPSLSPSSSPSLSPSSSPSLSPSSSPSLSPSSSPSLSPSSSPSLSPSSSPSLSPSSSPSLSPSSSPSLSPSSSPSLSPSSSPSFSSPLPQNLAVTKLSTVASVIRKATTLQTHPQSLPLHKSGFLQGPHKANIGNPASRTPQACDQTEQGGGCAQSPEDPASGNSLGNINSHGPGLGSLPHPRQLEPVSLVRLGAQRQSSELEATSGHSWLCLDGDCWEVILQSLESSQDLETTSVKILRAKSPGPKPLQREGTGTGPPRDVQMPEEGRGSMQTSPPTESVHPDWSSSGPHSMGTSLRFALSGSRTEPWFFDWFCDFETDLCGWQQNGTGAVWVLTRDQNSDPWRSSHPMESSCPFPGGSHLSLKSQTSPQTIPKAVLISPILHGARWVRFWYGPLQPAMGTISVYVYSRAQFGWHLIWSSMGHRSLSWSWVEMKLWASRKVQVMVEGIQGPEDGAHVSIDNLSVSSHQWPKGETKLPCHSFGDALNKA